MGVFLGLTLVYSVALSAVLWSLPRVSYNPSDALIVIPATSAILAARGATWRRRLVFAGIAMGGFLLADYVFLRSGLMHSSFEGLSQGDPWGSVVAVAYLAFAQGLPFVVMLLFVGRDPSVLWAKREAASAKSAMTTHKKPAGRK
jgi:hypothetical protein